MTDTAVITAERLAALQAIACTDVSDERRAATLTLCTELRNTRSQLRALEDLLLELDRQRVEASAGVDLRTLYEVARAIRQRRAGDRYRSATN